MACDFPSHLLLESWTEFGCGFIKRAQGSESGSSSECVQAGDENSENVSPPFDLLDHELCCQQYSFCFSLLLLNFII